MPVYAFGDTMCVMAGPNGTVNLGVGSGNTEGGISIVMTEEKNTMTIGADGQGMHSLHAGRASTVTVRLLKTSPSNAILSDMYMRDTASGVDHGQNMIHVRDLARGDDITCQEVAFAKFADVTYAKDGGEMVWTFHSIHTDFILGPISAVPPPVSV